MYRQNKSVGFIGIDNDDERVARAYGHGVIIIFGFSAPRK